MSDVEIHTDDLAPGWDAIDNSLAGLYSEEPLHFGTIVKYRMGGPDPIDGFSIFRSDKQAPHWHYVTYGLTELYEKESPDEEFSGYGFEFTMRIPRAPGDDSEADLTDKLVWVMSLMQNLARYVFETGNCFDVGHHIDLNSPILLESNSEIRAVLFAEDAELAPVDGPFGQFQFLQLFGITLDELRAVKQWNSRGMLELFRKTNPLLITDINRKSILNDASVRQAIEKGSEEEGSSTASLFVAEADWQTNGNACIFALGAFAVDDLRLILPARICHDRELFIRGKDLSFRFIPAEQNAWKVEDDTLEIALRKEDAKAFANMLQPKVGMYEFPGLSNFKLRIEKTEIKNNKGEVVEVIG